LTALIATLNALNFDEVKEKTRQSDGFREEVNEIIAILQDAEASGRGVHVFVSE